MCLPQWSLVACWLYKKLSSLDWGRELGKTLYQFASEVKMQKVS